MTRASLREYTKAVRGRYVRVSKKEKGRIWDEFTTVIGCHHKVILRLLRRGNQPRGNKKRGRPQQYDATDRLCSKRLHPFLPELVMILRRQGDQAMTTKIQARLCRMNPSTIDRLLHPWRRLGGCHLFTGACHLETLRNRAEHPAHQQRKAKSYKALVT